MPNSEPAENGMPLAWQHSAVWGLLARCFREPGSDLRRAAKNQLQAAAIRQAARKSGEVALEQNLERLGELARLWTGPGKLGRLREEFVRLFAHSRGVNCAPYETEYGVGHMFQQLQQLADLRGFYQAFGLELSEDCHERPDHISVELEFAHYLSFRQGLAELRNEQEAVEACRQAQATFLQDHLGRWTGRFGQVLREATECEFYQQLAAVTAAWTQAAARALEVEPVQAQVGPGAYRPEPPVACGDCGSACEDAAQSLAARGQTT